ncbi:GtrA family protein [Thiospirillum jenense]|uniref:GtrA family protein n=1 Tax=Thiospirillum jenense TaxID=1653858 RepID=A0A839HJI0_9GAMM|nr:GtrA family protein [Thiospirillum jenense]MBB1127106.1 GtrA family protein [Thiospirillum jenense]
MKWHIQFSRYAIVGIISNAIGYLLYLLLTSVGIGHKLAMTLLYVIGVLQTFYFNRNWSFKHQGESRSAFLRYLVSYALGYLLNLSVLYIAVDLFGLSHQIVQGGMIVTLALMLFLLQKYWVFVTQTTTNHTV